MRTFKSRLMRSLVNSMKPQIVKISGIIFFCLLGIWSAYSFADTIKLMSGKVIEGNIVEQTDEYVKIEREGKMIIVPIKAIDDGTEKGRWSWFRQKNDPKKQAGMSVRERLRAIREAELAAKQTPVDAPVEQTLITQDVAPEDSASQEQQKFEEEYENTQKVCTGFGKNIIDCPHLVCRQQHPTEKFIVEHFFKGYYSPDGSKNKCNYHQRIPGEEGAAIDCFLDADSRKEFFRSVSNDGSPVFSENKFLQKAVEQGICLEVKIPVLKQ